jgi:hypothetical protein
MQGTEELPPENPEVDAPEDPAPSEDEFLEGWRGGILLGLLLVFAAPYPVLFTIGDALARLYSIDGLVALIAERREMLIVAALQVAPVLLMLGFASRALRRRVVPPPFGRMPVVREHGWALPPAGLAGVVAPLTLGFWAGLGRLYPRRTAVLLGTGIMALLLVVWGATWRP